MATDNSNQDLLSAALDDAGLGDFLSPDAFGSFTDDDNHDLTASVAAPMTTSNNSFTGVTNYTAPVTYHVPQQQQQPSTQTFQPQQTVRLMNSSSSIGSNASPSTTIRVPNNIIVRRLPAATTVRPVVTPSPVIRTTGQVVRPVNGNHVIKTVGGGQIVIRATTASGGPTKLPSNIRFTTTQVNGKHVIIVKNTTSNVANSPSIPAPTTATTTSSAMSSTTPIIIPSGQIKMITTSALQSQPIVVKRPPSISSVKIIKPQGTAAGGTSLLAAKQSSPTLPSDPESKNQSASCVKKEEMKEEEEDLDDLVEEEEDHFQAETYADYMPIKLNIGLKHPDPVVETSSLSSVHPPNIWYRLTIPEDVIDEGRLSALQLEAITYACQQHETFLKDGSRAGFLLGDGAGVGKGRTLAGIIHENYLLGRKRAIWLSVSNDLRYDSERDLRDIGAKKIPVYPLNKFKYGKLSSHENGGVKKGVIFATYSSLIGESHVSNNKYRTRLKQLLHFCGEDFDGVIVFDECHKAKNLCPVGSTKPTKTGLTVLELQRRLPKARIVYASATGASEPKHMAYMVRLGLWGEGTAFKEFSDFANTVEKRGVGAMELVAIDMKLRGVYIARQLSFSGVQFRIEEIRLSNKFIRLYDDCVRIWVDAKNKIDRALELMEDDSHIKKAVWGQFWAAHQRFFKYLCIAAKVKHAVNLAREALKNDKCVVIGLQSTGEAKTLETLDDSGGELTDFVSTAKAVFQTMIEKHFPAPNRKKTLKLLSRGSSIMDDFGFSTNSLDDSLNPVDAILRKYESSDQERRSSVQQERIKGKIWSMSDSEDEVNSNKSSNNSVFDSDSDDEEDDFESVSEGEDIDSMWDAFATGVINKGKKKRIKKKKKPTAKKRKTTSGEQGFRAKKLKSEKRDMFDEMMSTKAEFMSDEALDLCEKMRDSLLNQIETLSSKLPPNTLDELIDELGGAENVAEMTGRKGRVISNELGSVQYESRTDNDVALEILNVTEKQRFMDGEKRIAIISEAASSGISLHSDKRVKNRRRRVHLTIELPWSADRAIQQFGRTHRSNQQSAPEYIFLISNLAGEQRFASIVAKRLESLGALTHGDRRATETRDFSRYNIDNKYGRQALEITMKSIIGQETAWVPPPTGFVNFFKEARQAFLGVGLLTKNEDGSFNLEKDFNVISKFLNRLLGIEVELQNGIFQYFSDTLEFVVKQAKRLGRYDIGIIDLTSDTAKIEKKSHQTFFHKHSTGAAKIELHEVAVERGMSWEDSCVLFKHCKSPDEGYYLTNSESSVLSKMGIFLAVSDASVKTFSKLVFRVYRPNTGLQSKTETASALKESSGTKKIEAKEAEDHWKRIFEESDKKCSHEIRTGRCLRRKNNLSCDVGLRKRIYHILSGSILSLWDTIEKTLPSNLQSKFQMARLKTADGHRVIGTLVPEKAVPLLIEKLSDKPTSEIPASSSFVKKEVSPTRDESTPKTPALSVPILHFH